MKIRFWQNLHGLLQLLPRFRGNWPNSHPKWFTTNSLNPKPWTLDTCIISWSNVLCMKQIRDLGNEFSRIWSVLTLWGLGSWGTGDAEHQLIGCDAKTILHTNTVPKPLGFHRLGCVLLHSPSHPCMLGRDLCTWLLTLRSCRNQQLSQNWGWTRV